MFPILYLLLLLSSLNLAQDDVVFRIRKCCPQHQQLSRLKYTECVDFSLNKYNYQSSGGDEGALENKPWWFPSGVDLISSKNETKLVTFPHNVNISYSRQPCDFDYTSFLLPDYLNFSFYDNGSLYVPENYNYPGNLMFPPYTYCIDSIADDTSDGNNSSNTTSVGLPGNSVVLLCPCETVTCIQKCCLPGMVLGVSANDGDQIGAKCVRDSKEFWLPEIKSTDTSSDYYLLYRKPTCGINEDIVLPNLQSGKDESRFVVKSDGTAQITGETYIIDKYMFCTDKIDFMNGTRTSPYLLRCSPKTGIQEKLMGNNRTVYGILFIIGSLFLFLTIIIYMLLPSRKTTNEKNLISQTWCLFIGYIGLAVGQLAVTELPPSMCTMLGFIVQYSFLAAFFWLNVLCFDISWTFSDLKPLSGSVAVRDKKKFIYYSLYGWLCPAVISLVTAIIEFLPDLPSHILRPEFRVSCWFRNESYAKLAYFFGPIAVLLFVNLLMFVFTTFKIVAAQRDTAMVNKNRNTDSKRLVLYFKLFLLMGLSWITELLSWIIGGDPRYWYVTDVINLLRPVFIFVILCCKRTVYDALKQRFQIGNTFASRRLESSRTSMTLATNLHQNHAARSQIATSQM